MGTFNNTLLSKFQSLLALLNKIFTDLRIYDSSKNIHIFTDAELIDFKIKLANFFILWKNCELNLSRSQVKLHLLLAHVPKFIEDFGFSPYVVAEHDLEHCHSKYDSFFENWNKSEKYVEECTVEFDALQY